MKSNQISFFENEESPKINDLKRNWENAFQRWSNNNGKCDYGSMCDYCSDVSTGRPCVRALNLMLKDKNKAIDYNIKNFEDIWDGEFMEVKNE